MYVQNTKPVRDSGKQQYTAAGWEVQLPKGGIHEWRKAAQGYWYTNCKANFPRALSLHSHKTGTFKHHKAVSFKSVFVQILSYGHESWVMTKKCYLIYKQQRWDFSLDPSRRSAQLWNS